MDPEAGHIHCGWDYDEADNTSNPVLRIGGLLHFEVSKLVPEIFNRVESNQ